MEDGLCYLKADCPVEWADKCNTENYWGTWDTGCIEFAAIDIWPYWAYDDEVNVVCVECLETTQDNVPIYTTKFGDCITYELYIECDPEGELALNHCVSCYSSEGAFQKYSNWELELNDAGETWTECAECDVGYENWDGECMIYECEAGFYPDYDLNECVAYEACDTLE